MRFDPADDDLLHVAADQFRLEIFDSARAEAELFNDLGRLGKVGYYFLGRALEASRILFRDDYRHFEQAGALYGFCDSSADR